MSEEQKEADKECCKHESGCGKKCGGCKFLAGVLVGLLLAGTGFGLFMAGHCAGRHGSCPMQSSAQNK